MKGTRRVPFISHSLRDVVIIRVASKSRHSLQDLSFIAASPGQLIEFLFLLFTEET